MPLQSDMFRQLTAGIKFDKKKFRSEAEKFGLTSKMSSKDEGNQEKLSVSLDDVVGVPDSNMPTPDDTSSDGGKSSDESDQEFTLLGDIKVNNGPKRKKPKKKKDSKEHLRRQHIQGVNRFRNVNKIHVKGNDIPDPIDEWSKLKDNYGLPENLLETVKQYYPKPTPVQMQAIPLLIELREALVCAPTGSGKTAAYLVPMIHHLREPRNKGFRAVIVAPTRELASQIHRECLKLCQVRQLRPYIIDKVNKSSKKLSGNKLDILVTTPNRLVYMLKTEVVSLKSVELLIVDESDKLFEAGSQGFRDQLAVIYQACDGSQVRRAMFSATIAADVEQWCTLNLDNVVQMTIGERNTATDTVEQSLVYTGTEKGKLLAFRQLIQGGLKPPVLVFVQEKERAKELFAELIKDNNNIHVDVIHSERSQLQRDNTVRAFRAGRVWVLICTEIMGRGIDFKGVNLVVNYDFPPSTVSYIHRIGRTGRAGRSGKAVTFFTDQDKVLLRSIATIVKNSGGEVPDYMLHMKKAKRSEKRMLAKSAVKRENIIKESLYDKERREKRARMISKSKAKKRKFDERKKTSD